MTINVDLLRRTLAHIEAHPEEWNQLNWQCGTAACFAGHAATLTGARWANPVAVGAIDHAGLLITPDGNREYVWDYTPAVLGVPHYTHPLFDATNTLDDLRRIVGELCDGAA